MVQAGAVLGAAVLGTTALEPLRAVDEGEDDVLASPPPALPAVSGDLAEHAAVAKSTAAQQQAAARRPTFDISG